MKVIFSKENPGLTLNENMVQWKYTAHTDGIRLFGGVSMRKRKQYIALVLCICMLTVTGALGLSEASSAVAALSANDAMTVVIDAGHGGEDGGASSASGVHESGLNLEISLRLNDLLHFLGVRTVLVRDADVSISTQGSTVAQRKVSDIRNRVKLVEGTPNAVLVSIHQNHFSESKYRGAQVFYAATQDSQALAEALQDALCTQVDPSNHRTCKQVQEVYLMKHITCPAVLVECGFLSNAEETRLLQSPEYQKKIAAALACCIKRYTEEQNEV